MTQTTVTKEDIKKIAQLCKLEVTGLEESLSEKFTDTLKYIDILNELDLSDVSETYQVTGLTNVFQSPDSTATLTNEEALSNAKEVINGLIATKAVFDR